MVRQQVSLNDLALLLPRQCAKYFITSSFFWLSPSHGGCYARTERSNLFWSHWSNQWLKNPSYSAVSKCPTAIPGHSLPRTAVNQSCWSSASASETCLGLHSENLAFNK